MPQWAKRDEAGTRAARKSKEFLDRRSWKGWRKDGSPFLRLHGRDKEAQYDRLHFLWNGTCAGCKAILIGKPRELDHIRSLGRGGDDADKNLQFLCRKCHQGRGGKHDRNPRLRSIPSGEAA
jgi:5-methylcytosine-specific restriction endonuclease McrA